MLPVLLVKPVHVSIHAPLARSNCSYGNLVNFSKFQYMLLLRGATPGKPVKRAAQIRFNTCSSCEEQHAGYDHHHIRRRFNTCSSCEEQLMSGAAKHHSFFVSIHAPLARSNEAHGVGNTVAGEFQYMLLLRGATKTDI